MRTGKIKAPYSRELLEAALIAVGASPAEYVNDDMDDAQGARLCITDAIEELQLKIGRIRFEATAQICAALERRSTTEAENKCLSRENAELRERMAALGAERDNLGDTCADLLGIDRGSAVMSWAQISKSPEYGAWQDTSPDQDVGMPEHRAWVLSHSRVKA